MSDNLSIKSEKNNKMKKLLTICIFFIVIAISVAGMFFVSFDNNMEMMLPENGEITRSMRFLRESDFSDKIILSVKLNDSVHSEIDLIKEVDQLSSTLKPPFITDVFCSVSENESAKDMFAFLKYLPQLTGKGALENIDSLINTEGIKSVLQKNYRQILSPSGMFTTPLIRTDPLGLKTGLLGKLQKFSSSTGYEVVIKNGHFLSRDGKHALMILKTSVPVSDGFGSRNLIAYLDKKLESLPPYISVDMISAHLHTLSNEDVIKNDIKLTTIIASIAFFLVFLFFFRDIKAILVFMIPLASIAVAISLSSVFLDKLSYFIIGMGATIAGISIDYGIHVYTAIRCCSNKADAVKQVAKPIIAGSLTTIGIFAAFFFSDVSGYRQLALFSIISIIFSLLCSLYFLPVFIERKNEYKINGLFESFSIFPKSVSETAQDKVWIFFWTILMITALFFSSKTVFDSDIKQFDGSNSQIFKAEESFQKAWGRKENPAILVVSQKNLEEALRENELIYNEAVKKLGNENISGFASLWPSEKTRSDNALRWNNFWTKEKVSKLRKLLSKEGKAYNFAENAFEPFFEHLYEGTDVSVDVNKNEFLKRIKERFVLKNEKGWQVITFFPDEESYITEFARISKAHPETFLVSRKSISKALSKAISHEIIYLSVIAALLLPVLTMILLKDIRLTVVALVPVFISVAAALGILPVTGLALNAPGILAIMILVGLCSDYGIFMVYKCRYGYNTGTVTAVFLAALTTLIGTGVLLFAKHPLLFSIGVTLFTGLLAGFLSSVIAVPSIYRLWIKDNKGYY
ncbi:MMPL family transporter [Desulfobacterium sp. N47]|uniref:MMPL family transporter n=1 Tax=Desulfobacterium sp. N47 TaxID=3115210 RepID=UPI003F4A6E00